MFQYLDEAIVLPDHHQWASYVGDKVKKAKNAVWSIMVEEWCKQCLNEQVANAFIETVNNALSQ